MRVWSANGSKRNICAVHSVEKLLELATLAQNPLFVIANTSWK
jgi:hypothetical protein